MIDSVQLKQRWTGGGREREEVLHLSGAINIENGKQGCRTAHEHNYAHTPTCAQREQKTNTNHECKALAVTDVGRELGGKRNTFISFCASFGFHGADATREKMGRESAGLPISRHTGLQS